MPSYRSYSDGQQYSFKKGGLLGGGAYGAVGDVAGRKDFIYKEIALTPKEGDWVILSRENRIKATYRELHALKTLNLLEGYIWENDTITIIMRKVDGAPEVASRPNFNFNPLDSGSMPNEIFFNGDEDPQRAVASFRALLELNRKGVYHLDPHPVNVLLTENADGTYHANWIDFGNATTYSFIASLGQNQDFDATRAYNSPADYKKALNEFRKKYQLQDYFYTGARIATGVGIVCVFGGTSALLWQIARSQVSHVVLREIRTVLDYQDIFYSKNLNNPNYTNGQKKRWKAAINLGYVLLNVYTISNLYLSVSSLKLTTDVNAILEQLKSLDNSTFDKMLSNCYNTCILPLCENISAILNAPSNYAQVIPTAVLDKALAEMAYLYAHLKDTSACFTNMLERALPAEHLLYRSEVLFNYNPKLLFTYAATRAKEMVWGNDVNNEQSNNPRMVSS